jgi:hypothetical protein
MVVDCYKEANLMKKGILHWLRRNWEFICLLLILFIIFYIMFR